MMMVVMVMMMVMLMVMMVMGMVIESIRPIELHIGARDFYDARILT